MSKYEDLLETLDWLIEQETIYSYNAVDYITDLFPQYEVMPGHVNEWAEQEILVFLETGNGWVTITVTQWEDSFDIVQVEVPVL